MLFSRSELKPLLHRISTNDPSLLSLHLCHKKITNRQLLQISDALRSNTTVGEIWLTNNRICDESEGGGSVAYLASALEGNDAVGEVYLGGNKIGAKGASSIADLLRKNRVITDIGLEDNAICDGGARMLADALGHNPTLQTLKLQGNDIQTERTLESIRDSLRKNKESARARLAAERPELTTHKLKKPEPERSRRRRKKRSSGDDGKSRRRGEGDKKGGGKESSSSSSSRPRGSHPDEGVRKPSSSSRPPQSSVPINGYMDNARPIGDDLNASDAFIADRKTAIEEAKPTTSNFANKFKTMGLGSGGKGDGGVAGMKKKGMKSAAFV